MDLLDPKRLKKLADACRKVGIKHFKSAEFEFTLTDHDPSVKTSKQKKLKPLVDNDTIESEAPTDEELLMWSVGDMTAPANEEIQ